MSLKTYRLFCEMCSWKRITDGSDLQDLVEIKKSKIQRGIPRIDPATKKVVEPNWKKMPKQWKCPQCGRPVKAVKISNPQLALEERLERERAEEIRKETQIKIIEDMKSRYKERRAQEIEKAEKDAETRQIAREVEAARLQEELQRIEGFKIEGKEHEEDRPDGSETSSEG